MLPDERRQILNFALPGDFLGLQASVFDRMGHSAEALTDMVLCIFPREKLWGLFSGHPNMSFDVTWLAAREERMFDENLLGVGRRSALERMAYPLLHLFRHTERSRLDRGRSHRVPVLSTTSGGRVGNVARARQQHVTSADVAKNRALE